MRAVALGRALPPSRPKTAHWAVFPRSFIGCLALRGFAPCAPAHAAWCGAPPAPPVRSLFAPRCSLRRLSARATQGAIAPLAFRSVVLSFRSARSLRLVGSVVGVRGLLSRRSCASSALRPPRPTRFPPPRAFLPLPLHGGGLSRSPLSGSPARVGALRAPRRFKRSCRLRAALMRKAKRVGNDRACGQPPPRPANLGGVRQCPKSSAGQGSYS